MIQAGGRTVATNDKEQPSVEAPAETPAEPTSQRPTLPDPGKKMKLTRPTRDDDVMEL